MYTFNQYLSFFFVIFQFLLPFACWIFGLNSACFGPQLCLGAPVMSIGLFRFKKTDFKNRKTTKKNNFEKSKTKGSELIIFETGCFSYFSLQILVLK